MKEFNSFDIEKIIGGIEIDDSAKETICKNIKYAIDNYSEVVSKEPELIGKRLQIHFEYEKHYLELIKEYKEEIKFVNTLQEDLRRERTKFFSEDLKDVAESLKESDVDTQITSKWIQQLVMNYTKSLDVSQNLIDIKAMDIVGDLKRETQKEIELLNESE